jgi:NADPH:quinone reductase-like Zn-dependent oxidoreductase
VECGASVQEFKPGDRIAAAVPHAAYSVVGRNLCARVPEGVSFESAAYASVSAIAMEGVRLARLALGETALVIGLGLIGQIAVALLKAQGCRVFGIDIPPPRSRGLVNSVSMRRKPAPHGWSRRSRAVSVLTPF